MHQIGHLLRIGMLILAVMVSSPLHANEQEVCIPADTQVAGHFDGDGDQAPPDASEHAAHHHGGCSGHQFATVAADDRDFATSGKRNSSSRVDDALIGASPENLLRPPIA